MNDAEKEQKIHKIIAHLQQVPTLPVVCSKLASIMADPKTTAQHVSKIIEEDQALTAKVLKVVNSAFYGFPKKIKTVSHAIVLLGFNEVRNIVYSMSIIKLFGEGRQAHRFNHEEFWQHSIGVGVCARVISTRAKVQMAKIGEEVFVCGLLHDIGKIVEDQFMHDEFSRVLALREEEKLSLLAAEDRVLGFNHQDVGYLLAEKWNLPSSLVAVVQFHNSLTQQIRRSNFFELIAIIHCANVFARALQLGSGGDPYVPALDRDCWEVLGLRKSYIEIIMDETQVGYEEIAALLFE